MTYAEAVARLTALRGGEHVGMRPGLERVEALLAALGHPEQQYALVQVGGTNGKGSAAAMLAACLQAAGRRVGLYTSPHLVSFRERIRVNGEPISEDGVVDGVDALGTLVARLEATMFEATTALALDHFAREGVEIAVLEVGLGGRLDATTVGRPVLTVLTRIDRDHETVLGATLEAIAREKAAIIRSGLALSAAQAPGVEAVIVERAAAAGVELLLEGRDLTVTVESQSLAGQVIRCEGPGWALPGVTLALAGTFQPSNALLAVAAARHLGVGEAAIRTALGRLRWPGRFEVRAGDPLLILDGAHNPGAARALADSLRLLCPERPLTLVFGVSRDKDAGAMLRALAPLAHRVILTRAANPRAAEPADLEGLLPPGPARVDVAPDVLKALALAVEDPRTPTVCVTGSLFVVAEVLALLDGPDRPCALENPPASMRAPFRAHLASLQRPPARAPDG